MIKTFLNDVKNIDKKIISLMFKRFQNIFTYFSTFSLYTCII